MTSDEGVSSARATGQTLKLTRARGVGLSIDAKNNSKCSRNFNVVPRP